MVEHCCDKLARAVADDNIVAYARRGMRVIYRIYGAPSSVSDGDGYYDDMTDEIEISYCPFCGEKLGQIKSAADSS